MTLLAGIYCRRAGESVSDAVCDMLGRAISRHSGDRIEHYRDARCFLAKVDIGAYGEPAARVDPAAVTFMVGEPLLSRSTTSPRSRAADLNEIHDALRTGENRPLTRARGVFAAVHYQPGSGTLILLTDKLGIRPIYYWLGEQYAVFASALRILEQMPDIPKVLDVRAVTEIASIGFALGERTPFASVNLLRSAGMVRLQGAASSRHSYWRWDDIGISDRPVNELATESYRAFTDAVALRNRRDTTTVAFLSGGLDSRSTVMALRELGTHVHTFNFSLPGTQDEVFGAAVARDLGTMHLQAMGSHAPPNWAMLMAEAWRASPHRLTQPAERPMLVWSGDGGSVGLGHVYLNQRIVDAARAGHPEVAADLVSRGWGGDVPRRLMRRGIQACLAGLASRGLVEEFAELRGADAGRRMHLVLMHTDQHRHLAEFFETIDMHRLEYQLPFFDSEFLASVLRVPVDVCLGHAYYMQVLRHFPPAMLSVPWQTYPGHEACPLPLPSGVKYQWERSQQQAMRTADRRLLVRRALDMLGAADFPDPLLNRHFLRLAAWTYRLRLRDLGYVIRAATTFGQYWSRCAGKYALPG